MKLSKITLVILALFSATMFAQQIQSGVLKFDINTPDFTLNKNEGDRLVQMEVAFPKPFTIKPDVFLFVNFLDADKGTNTRYEVKSMSISRDGFICQVKTWADTKIHGIGVSWMALSSAK